MQLGVGLVERLTVAGGLPQRGPQTRRAVTGDPDQAGLLVERPTNRLANPERRIGRELEAAPPVELVDGMLQAEVALLDQIEQIHPLGQRIAPGNRHHETQVGADETVLGVGSCGDGALQRHAALAVGQLLGGLAAGLDDARQLSLVLGSEQGNLADVVQIQADGVIHCAVVNRSCCDLADVPRASQAVSRTMAEPWLNTNLCHQ